MSPRPDPRAPRGPAALPASALARAAAWALALAACAPEAAPPSETARGRADRRAPADAASAGAGSAREPLPDEAAARGLAYVNRSGRADKPTILEANGAGVALVDLGGDGDLDVVLAQGLGAPADLARAPGADLEVFENDGAGRFRRVAGPGLSGWWNGLATGDLDGDGRMDVVATGFGDVAVLLQTEDGALARVEASGAEPEPALRLLPGAERAADAPAPAWSTSAALVDLDRDGALDLYVGRYLELDPFDPPLGELGRGELAVACAWKGHAVYCGPRGLVPQSDRVYRGLGDGRFEDVTAAWLGDVPAGYTLGVRPLDVDLDGDQDLYVATDSSPNCLFVNRGAADEGGPLLVDRAFERGVALSPEGRPEAGMGIDAGDVDGDGRLDLVVTNFSDEPTALYANVGDGGFRDVTHRVGLYGETRRLLSWGVVLEDLDGDGALDLFTANGHVYPQADREHTGTSYGQPDGLWRFERDGPDGLGRARRVTPASDASILAPATGTRGTAIGDVDGDGAPDLVLTRIDGPAALGMNRFAGAHRLAVRLVARAAQDGPGPRSAPDGPGPRRSAPDGIGARVELVVGGTRLVRDVQTARGYQSASSPWTHFGLGDAMRFDALVVRWPSGVVDEVPAGDADRSLWVREGEGVVRAEAFR